MAGENSIRDDVTPTSSNVAKSARGNYGVYGLVVVHFAATAWFAFAVWVDTPSGQLGYGFLFALGGVQAASASFHAARSTSNSRSRRTMGCDAKC
jgi:hypothetical protein